MPRPRQAGLTLVEAALIVCVIGIVLAIFIPAFVAELRTSKTSEAVEQLQRLSQASAAYYLQPQAQDAGLSLRRCLPATAGPTPRTPTSEAARVSFGATETPGHLTWRALDFQPGREIRYSYTFEPTASGCGLRSPEGSYLLTLRAEGDLDGDGERSLFERRLAATDTGELRSFGILYVRDRAE